MRTDRTIGLIGAGAMGAALGQLFAGCGLRVLSPLAGRSSQTRQRAIEAGIKDASYADLLAADIVLSVVPPTEAEQVVQDFVSAGNGAEFPLFIEANALSPDSKRMLEKAVNDVSGRFVDGAIIGMPPSESIDGPRLYVSGKHAQSALLLREAGLDVRAIDGPVGAAAALKMCYGGFNKGITALTTAAMLSARRVGVQDLLMAEFAISQQALLKRSQSAVPRMYPKAYRWIAEFEEIAAFASEDPASADIFDAIGRFYKDRASANEKGEEQNQVLALLDTAGG